MLVSAKNLCLQFERLPPLAHSIAAVCKNSLHLCKLHFIECSFIDVPLKQMIPFHLQLLCLVNCTNISDGMWLWLARGRSQPLTIVVVPSLDHLLVAQCVFLQQQEFGLLRKTITWL